jgi:hypothetical protein
MRIKLDDEVKRYAFRGTGVYFRGEKGLITIKGEQLRRSGELVLMIMLRASVRTGTARHHYAIKSKTDVFVSTPLLAALVGKLYRGGAIEPPLDGAWRAELVIERSLFFKGKHLLLPPTHVRS